MKLSRSVLSCLLFSGIVFSLFSLNIGYGSQPALELPQWLDLGLRFTSLPYPGKETTIIGEVYTLVGNGEKATVTFDIPDGFSLLSGDKSQVIELFKGRRKRLTIKVRSDVPCGESQVRIIVTADYPVNGMKEEISASTADEELRNKRIRLAESLKGNRTVSFVERIFVSKDEIMVGDREVVWRNLEKVSSTDGFFLARDMYDAQDIKETKNRLRQFENYERILKSKGNMDAFFSGKYRAMRVKKIAEYGEDLYSLAVYYYKNQTVDNERMNKLVAKAASYSEINRETIVALQNLLALTNVRSKEAGKALKVWASLGEKPSTGTFSAYMLYNAGEALRIIGKHNESAEFFRAALNERPGLLIARERLRTVSIK
jgi:hypothetical protein